MEHFLNLKTQAMAFNVQTFLTRLGSAVVFTAVMLLGLIGHVYAFIGLFFLVTILCLKEYVQLIEKIVQTSFSSHEKTGFMAMGITAFLAIIAMPMGLCGNAIYELIHFQFFFLIGLFIGSCLYFLGIRKNPKAWHLMGGIGYIAVSLALLVQLRYQSLLLPVMLLFFIWMNDTMAYLTGSFIGKTPFAPSISPKKTIEGTLGGMVFTLLFAGIWGYFYHAFPLYQWLVIGFIASIIGTIGDLIESKLKRMAGVKDSGAIMPGHGGALDRFDSLLFAAPFAYLYAMLDMACFQVSVF